MSVVSKDQNKTKEIQDYHLYFNGLKQKQKDLRRQIKHKNNSSIS